MPDPHAMGDWEVPHRDEVVSELAEALSRGYVQRTGSFTQYADEIVRYIEAIVEGKAKSACQGGCGSCISCGGNDGYGPAPHHKPDCYFASWEDERHGA
jgi:hypothetical protein